MSNPFRDLKTAKPFRPQFNVGCLFDVMTGRYEPGMRGEMILNGGVANIESWAGAGNSFKSTMAHYRMLIVLYRYFNAYGFMYDTENSATLRRLQDLANVIDPSGKLAEQLDPLDDSVEPRLWFTDSTTYNGSEWWDQFRGAMAARIKTAKEEETPFKNPKTNKPFTLLPPLVGEIDSFSQFQSAVVFEKAATGTVGDSEMNPVAMQNAGAKSQLLDSLPYLASKAGFSIALNSHMGNTIQMDKYSGDKKQLAYLSTKRKMKKTSENITFLTNNLFEITGTSPCINDKTKLPEYPRNENDDIKQMTDLTEVTILPLRTKGGIAGFPFKVIVSQRYGVQPTLTEFSYLKAYGRFGLGSNVVQNKLDLLPDTTFTRNNVRQFQDNDPKFRRAMEITAEMCVMNNLWPEFAEKWLVEPAQLREGLIKQGYDWDVLLATRGYWVFDQYTHPIPFLSTFDLLRMYHGEYKPYWL